jgi:hypothetical protein
MSSKRGLAACVIPSNFSTDPFFMLDIYDRDCRGSKPTRWFFYRIPHLAPASGDPSQKPWRRATDQRKLYLANAAV